MKFTNLSTLLNPKPPPTPKFDTHTQSGIIPILNGQNFTWVSIGMNKLWGEIKAYLKWVSIGAVGKPFFLASVSRWIVLFRKTIPTNRERIDWRERERGSMREKERGRESLPIDEGG